MEGVWLEEGERKMSWGSGVFSPNLPKSFFPKIWRNLDGGKFDR